MTTISTFDLFNKLFEDVHCELNGIYPQSFPPCNVYLQEESKDLLLEFAVAGIPKESIELSVEDQYLLISIDRVDDKKEGFLLKQKGIRTSSVKRKFVVPSSKYSLDKIKTSLKDGMLSIEIPAKAEMKRKFIKIG